MRVCPKCKSSYASKTQFCGIDGDRLVDATDDPLLTETLGKYKLVEQIGRGAMGSVYRAIHTELGSEFAVKVLLGDFGSDEEICGRFRREAQTASKIRAINVVTVVDVGTTQSGLTYLVMEYAKGRPLDRVIRDEAPLDTLRAARIVRDVAAGLDVAHRLGFVHRDIKPANIFLCEEGGREIAKILDFGIVRVETTEEATKLTQQGQIIGTPAYMAPEQWKGSAVGPPADLYSLGCVLIEMLTGRKPFRGKSVMEIMAKHSTQAAPVVPPSDGLEHIAARLVEKDETNRYQHAAEVADLAEEITVSLSMGAITGRPVLRTGASGVGATTPAVGNAATQPAALAELSAEDTLVRSDHNAAVPNAASATTNDITTGTPAAPKRNFPVFAAVAVIVGLGGGIVAWRAVKPSDVTIITAVADEEPTHATPTPLATLDHRLNETLKAHGLDLADFARLAPEPATAWAAARTDVKRANALFESTLAAATPLRLNNRLLRTKLESLDSKLAAVRTPELEKEYLGLYQDIAEIKTEADAISMSNRIRAFAAKL